VGLGEVGKPAFNIVQMPSERFPVPIGGPQCKATRSGYREDARKMTLGWGRRTQDSASPHRASSCSQHRSTSA